MSMTNAIFRSIIHNIGSLVLGLCFAVLMAPQAFAQSAADSACDPEYMKSLKSRAWLEAQREITQNQNIILKPDSVLQYSCFNTYLDELANNAGSLFSESSDWGSSPANMGSAIGYIKTSTSSYINTNFSNQVLGGRANANGNNNPCDVMNQIWEKAKCMNATDDPNTGFFTFDEYASGGDKRQCSSNADWNTNISDASGADVPWVRDDMENYLDRLDPQNCGARDDKFAAISTGLIIRSSGEGLPNEYYEKICVMPGCHYVPTDKDKGDCKPATGL